MHAPQIRKTRSASVAMLSEDIAGGRLPCASSGNGGKRQPEASEIAAAENVGRHDHAGGEQRLDCPSVTHRYAHLIRRPPAHNGRKSAPVASETQRRAGLQCVGGARGARRSRCVNGAPERRRRRDRERRPEASIAAALIGGSAVGLGAVQPVGVEDQERDAAGAMRDRWLPIGRSCERPASPTGDVEARWRCRSTTRP